VKAKDPSGGHARIGSSSISRGKKSKRKNWRTMGGGGGGEGKKGKTEEKKKDLEQNKKRSIGGQSCARKQKGSR